MEKVLDEYLEKMEKYLKHPLVVFAMHCSSQLQLQQ